MSKNSCIPTHVAHMGASDIWQYERVADFLFLQSGMHSLVSGTHLAFRLKRHRLIYSVRFAFNKVGGILLLMNATVLCLFAKNLNIQGVSQRVAIGRIYRNNGYGYRYVLFPEPGLGVLKLSGPNLLNHAIT